MAHFCFCVLVLSADKFVVLMVNTTVSGDEGKGVAADSEIGATWNAADSAG